MAGSYQDQLTESEQKTRDRILSGFMDAPERFRAWAVSFFENNPPLIPVGQVFGFKVSIRAAPIIATQESVGSTGSYVDLATVGPEITDLASGTYLVIFGASVKVASGGQTMNVSISVSGSTPLDDDGFEQASQQETEGVRAKLVTISGTGSIKVQYKASSTSPTFAKRWLIAIRVQ